MNKTLSKWLFYYPSVLAKGELVPLYRRRYEQSQWWNEKHLKREQLKAFQNIVSWAIKQSPFYRDLYADAGVRSGEDVQSVDDVRALPSIDKSVLIEHRDAIYTKMLLPTGTKTTGGSTGHPVQIKKNIDALARERAITWRSYAWAGVEVGDRQARFWGVPHSEAGRFKAKITDLVANRMRISAFDMGSERLHKYYGELCSDAPEYIYGYVSAIRLLAAYVLERGLLPWSRLKAIITTAEVLDAPSRKLIESAFGVKVFNEYGCGEVGSIAHECESGSMHVMAENLLVEIDSPSLDHSGELIVTDFYNMATPLIRYRVGDFAAGSSQSCSCGRGLPVISAIHGRAYDLIRLPSGKVVHPESLIYVFESLQSQTGAFKQFQAIQREVDRVELYIVPANEWNGDIQEKLKTEIKRVLDPGIQVEVELKESLERERSGKMRLVKSDVR